MASFNKGDVVQLKSGGPKMTVDKTGNHGMTGQPTVWCVWFDKDGVRQTATFSPDSLEPAK